MKKQQLFLFLLLTLALTLTIPGVSMAKEIKVTVTIDDNGIMGSQIFNFIGIGYKDIGRLDEAERVLLLGVEYYQSYNLAYNLAGVFIERGDKENAKLMLQIAKIRKDNSGVIILSDNERLTNKNSKPPPHQEFSPEEVKHLIPILVKELKLYYKECKQCEHINMFLGNLYSNQGDYLKAIQYFDREITVNTNDISGFSSSSSMLRGLYKNKLSDQEKLQYVVSIKDANKIVESLDMLDKRLTNSKDDKSDIFKNILLAFSIFENMKEIISRDLDINLSDDINENIKVLNSHADFKLPEKTAIIKKMESNSEAFKIFETSNDIYQFLQYLRKIIFYNFPLIESKKDNYSTSLNSILDRVITKNNLDIWIWYYPPSPLSEEDGQSFIKNKNAAYELKNILFKHGFHNIMITSSPEKTPETLIEHVNNVPASTLSKINTILTDEFLVKQKTAILIKKNNNSVGYTHPSISIKLGWHE